MSLKIRRERRCLEYTEGTNRKKGEQNIPPLIFGYGNKRWTHKVACAHPVPAGQKCFLAFDSTGHASRKRSPLDRTNEVPKVFGEAPRAPVIVSAICSTLVHYKNSRTMTAKTPWFASETHWSKKF